MKIELYLIIYLIILQVINIGSTLVEAIIVRQIRIIKVKYIIIYPFVKDRRWLFKPIKMTLNYECINDGLLFNLAEGIKQGKTEEKLYNQLKKMIMIKDISVIISASFGFALLSYVLKDSFLLEYICFIIGCLSLTFLYHGAGWYGSRYMLKNRLLYNFLYKLPNLEEFTAKDYGEFLRQNLDRDKYFKYDCIDILENYLLACVAEERAYLNDEALTKIYKAIFKEEHFKKFHSIKFNTHKNSQIKLIGILSRFISTNPYRTLFENEMYRTLTELSEVQCFYKLRDDIKVFIGFVSGEPIVVKSKKHLVISVRNYMSNRISIGKKIDEWLLSVVK